MGRKVELMSGRIESLRWREVRLAWELLLRPSMIAASGGMTDRWRYDGQVEGFETVK